MQLIFDNLTAVIVSAIMIGVVLTLNVRSQATAVEATRHYAATTKQNALVDLIEYDLEDLGSGVATGSQMITAYERDALGTKTFEFMRELADASGEIQLARIRYERSYAGSHTTGDSVVIPSFHVRRLVEKEDGTFVSTTGEGFEVVYLDFALLGEDGEAVTSNLDAATNVEVHLRSALPFQDGADRMRFTSWAGTFRPSNLARRSSAVGG
jgi:hypothetical protein